MNNECKQLLDDKLEQFFSTKTFNNFEEKLSKDIDDLEQMKLDFCDIYRKCINT